MGITLRFCAECTTKAVAWAEEMARSHRAKRATGIFIRMEDRRPKFKWPRGVIPMDQWADD